MNDWDDCVQEAKEELGITGFTNRWDEVIELAKEKYWDGESFKELKNETIESANNECQLCYETERLTAHHIIYGTNESTICVCKNCHKILHSPEISKYGFVLQAYLLSIIEDNFEIPNNLTDMVNKVASLIHNKLDKKDDTPTTSN